MNRDTITPYVKGALPGENARAWVDYYKSSAAKTTQAYPFVWDIYAPATGPFCTDADGNILLDFVGHVGASPLGYNNPELMNYLSRLNFTVPAKYAGQDFYIATSARPNASSMATPAKLMEKILESTQQFGFGTVFLSNSGAEAVENAMKICYDKNPKTKHIIAFKGAFHGRTIGVLSVNASKKVQKKSFPVVPQVHHVHYCSCEDNTACKCGWMVEDPRSRERMSELEQMLGKTGYIDPADVGFILMEPVQGEGGYLVPNRAFMNELSGISKKYNIPLIADEVQSGMGRTGRLWAIEHFGIKPDIITSAKALQVGATISRKDMFPEQSGRISSTWGGGDILNSAIGYKTLEIIMRDKLYDHATVMGAYFMHNLGMIKSKSPIVTDARGLGLMIAVEFQTPEQRNKVEEECFQRGFMTLSCGYKALRFLPPLDVTKREVDIGCNILEGVLKTFQKA